MGIPTLCFARNFSLQTALRWKFCRSPLPAQEFVPKFPGWKPPKGTEVDFGHWTPPRWPKISGGPSTSCCHRLRGRQQLREEIRWRLFPINNGQFNYSRDRDEALSSLLAAEVRQELHGAATGRWHILLHVHSFSMLHRMKHSQVIPAFLSDVHHPGIRENAGKRLLNHNRSF